MSLGNLRTLVRAGGTEVCCVYQVNFFKYRCGLIPKQSSLRWSVAHHHANLRAAGHVKSFCRGATVGANLKKPRTSHHGKYFGRLAHRVRQIESGDFLLVNDNLKRGRILGEKLRDVLRAEVGDDVSELINLQHHTL